MQKLARENILSMRLYITSVPLLPIGYHCLQELAVISLTIWTVMKLSNPVIVYIRTLKSRMARFSETWNFGYKNSLCTYWYLRANYDWLKSANIFPALYCLLLKPHYQPIGLRANAAWFIESELLRYCFCITRRIWWEGLVHVVVNMHMGIT